jgi:outer membrane protein assembly factor BamA
MAVLDAGLLWDTRDHDLVPSRGVFHEASLRFTPDPRSDVSYAGATVALRFYRPLYRDRLVLAARVMGDMLFGDPPIYELARHGGLFPMPAPGGGSGVRGVPMQRYHGKVKLLSNLELRARVLPLSVFGQRFNIGAIAFFDAGRVWSDFTASERLDGSGPGIKVGFGGGLRIQWGEAFLLRTDVAWSPDADPIGFYFNVNHVF